MMESFLGNNIICGDDQEEEPSREVATAAKSQTRSQRPSRQQDRSALALFRHPDLGRKVLNVVIHSETD
jgi:hypothetical protein